MRLDASMNNLNPKYAGILTIIIGAGLIGWSYHMRGVAAASEAWPSVAGEITISEVTHSVNQSSSSGNKWRY
jgi:hypothetical protein